MNPAHAAHRQPRVSPFTFLNHLVPTILMGIIMALCYMAGFHQPEPHHLPMAVVGQGQQSAAAADKLQSALGDMADVELIPTRQMAEASLKRLDIVAAMVPGAKGSEVLTAPARSDTTTVTVERIFAAVSEKSGTPVKFTSVVPLNGHDSAGQNSFFFLVVASVSIYALGIAVSVAGSTYSFRARAAWGLLGAVTVGSILFLIARFGMNMFDGHGWAVWAIAMLYVVTVMFLVVGLHPILGRWSAMAFSALFVALNFTTSGGVFEAFMQPAFFQWFNHFWIGSGFISSVRQIVYFNDASSANALGILFAWFAISILVLLLGAAWESARNLRRSVPVRHVLDRDEKIDEELEEDVAV